MVSQPENQNDDEKKIVSKFRDVKTVTPNQSGLAGPFPPIKSLKMKGNQLSIQRNILPVKHFKEDVK